MGDRLQALVRPGSTTPWRAATRFVVRRWLRMATRRQPDYRSPDAAELAAIEVRLAALGIPCGDLRIASDEFAAFMAAMPFPDGYHGGHDGGVYAEKLLEHFVAWKLAGIGEASAQPYVDVAAGGSPWAKILRERGIDAFAVDLAVDPGHAGLPYYLQRDATRSGFDDASIGSASLQCAYEMFTGRSDIELVAELARILRPGGRAVIAPLYMHTHACHYQTQEFVSRFAGDDGATTYVRRDLWGVPSSRKYSPETLRDRVWRPALAARLRPSLLALRDRTGLGDGIYLHFVLLLDRPAEAA